MKLISISLSPNVFPEDIDAAKTMFSHPLLWREGKDIAAFENGLVAYFGSPTSKNIYTFNSGRSALLSLLRAFGIGKGDEVLLQAFTCNAVPNPVIWAGARPVYVDVKEATFNMDASDAVEKINRKTKAIIVQHTFGLSADMDTILTIAKKHKLIVIEDCAHALGAEYKGKKVGTLGDAAFFSFGRDKVISSVYGGAAFISSRLKVKSEKLDEIYQTLPYPSARWVRQQLRHPLLMNELVKWYNVPFTNHGVGKLLLQAFQLSRLVSKAVHWKEKQGLKPDYFPAHMPNAFAYLALKQFERLDEFNAHRRQLAGFYHKELQATSYKLQPLTEGHIYLRYPVWHKNAGEIIQKAKMAGILLGDWYNSPVAPDDTNLEKMHYKKGSCPVAEKVSREIFNLPTNPNLSIEEAKRVVKFLKTIEI